MTTRSLVTLALLLLTVGADIGCGKHMYTRDDLDVSLFQHHNNLRWGRLENAALTVKPEMRASFLQIWASRMQVMELQDVDVAGVAMSPDGESADVVVNITWIDKSSMTVKTSPITEHWIKTEDGWQSDHVSPPGSPAGAPMGE